MSVVYYKFRSGKDLKRLHFEGTGISVFDLKREILLAEKLDQTADTFSLTLETPDTKEVYDDDNVVIPRSSSVIVLRTPVTRIGAYYSASRYVTGQAAASKNAARKEDFDAKPEQEEMVYTPATNKGQTESDVLHAMFAQQGAQWMQTQQEMASQTPIYFNRNAQQNTGEVDKTVPPNYICNRCGQKGHWIANCPSIYDPNWETKKIRRTTGIPKTMLKTIQKPENVEDGKTYLMNADGEYVVALTDEKSWEDFQARQLQQQAKHNREIPANLQDPITNELMKNPQRMPCCGKVYSNESIENALIQTDFKCPNCDKVDVYIDQLIPDTETAAEIKQFIAESDNKEGEEAANVQAGSGDEQGEAANETSDMDIDDAEDYNPDPDSDSSVEDIEIRQSRSTNNTEAEHSQEPDTTQQINQNFNPLMPVPLFPFMMPEMAAGKTPPKRDELALELAMDIQGRIR